MSLNWTDFIKMVKTSFKHGSLLIALFIPIITVLGYTNFVSTSFMWTVNEIIVIIELALAFFRLGLNEYLKSKTLIADVKKKISEGHIEEAQEIIEDNIDKLTDFAEKTTKAIINAIKKGEKPIGKEVVENIIKDSKIEERLGPEIPGYQISER